MRRATGDLFAVRPNGRF